MSSTTKTLEHVIPAYNLPRGRAVGRGKVAEAAQQTAEAEAPHAAPAQAAEGRMVCSFMRNGASGEREAEEDWRRMPKSAGTFRSLGVNNE
jgi:hypothetical protein